MNSEELRAWREAFGLSRQQLAETIRVPVRTLEGYENGRPIPEYMAILLDVAAQQHKQRVTDAEEILLRKYERKEI